jgi:hypothetical protein
MDCYDMTWCPNGECDLCDFWMERGMSRRRAAWMRFRRFFVRLWRRDFSAGYVNMAPPSAVEALVSIAKHAEREAGRCRYNLNPSALGSYWDGHDKAMKDIAALCRERVEALAPTPTPAEPATKENA